MRLLVSFTGNEKLALQIEFTLPSDSYVFMALRELVNLNTSGFTNMYEMSRRYLPREKKKEIVPGKGSTSKPIATTKSKENKIRERLDGTKRASASLAAPNRASRRRSSSPVIDLTREERNNRDNNKGQRRSRFDESRSPDARRRSPDFRSARGRSREVLAKDNFIEIRLTNDRRQAEIDRRPNPFQSRVEVFDEHVRVPFQDPTSDFRDPFDRGNPSMRMVDGVAMCEFRTETNYPPQAVEEPEWDREERIERERRMREAAAFDERRDRRLEPRGRSPIFQTERNPMPMERQFDSFERNQQFIRNTQPLFDRPQSFEPIRGNVPFDRRRDEPRSVDPIPMINRGVPVPMPIEEDYDRTRFSSRAEQDRFEAGRLLAPPAWLNSNIRPDDLRNQLTQRSAGNERNVVYDPEREFEEIERRQIMRRDEPVKRYSDHDLSPVGGNKMRRIDDNRRDDRWDVNRSSGNYGGRVPEAFVAPSATGGGSSSGGYRSLDERAIIQERLDQINRARIVQLENTADFERRRQRSPSPQRRGFSPRRQALSPGFRVATSPARIPSPPIISGYRRSRSPSKRDIHRSRSPVKRLSPLPRSSGGNAGNQSLNFYNRDEPLGRNNVPNNNFNNFGPSSGGPPNKSAPGNFGVGNFGPNSGPNNNWQNSGPRMGDGPSGPVWQNNGNFPPNNDNFGRGNFGGVGVNNIGTGNNNFGPPGNMMNNFGPQQQQQQGPRGGVGGPGNFNNFGGPMPMSGPNNFGPGGNFGGTATNQQKIGGFGGHQIPPQGNNNMGPAPGTVWNNQGPMNQQQQQPFQDRFLGGGGFNNFGGGFNNFGGPNQGPGGNMGMRRF